MVYDTTNDLVCFAGNVSGTIIFKRFDPNTFLLHDQFPVSGISSFPPPRSITTCGHGCYAFNTSDHIVILKDELVGLRERPSHQVFRVHPNPATDRITISGISDIEHLEILDMNGRMLNWISGPTPYSIDVSDLATGHYMLRLLDRRGAVHVARFVK